MAITSDGSQNFGISSTIIISGFTVESYSENQSSTRVDLNDSNGEPLGSTVIPSRVEVASTLVFNAAAPTLPTIGQLIRLRNKIVLITGVSKIEAQASYRRISITGYVKINLLTANLISGKPAAIAHSTRLVDDTYTGPALRVRHGHTSTEYYIYFDDDGDLSSSSKTVAVVGGAESTVGSVWTSGQSNQTGYVHTWYDQSQNGYHLQQATTNNQPQVISSGNFTSTYKLSTKQKVAIQFGSLAKMYYLGSGSVVPGSLLKGANGMALYAVLTSSSPSPFGTAFWQMRTSTDSYFYRARFYAGGSHGYDTSKYLVSLNLSDGSHTGIATTKNVSRGSTLNTDFYGFNAGISAQAGKQYYSLSGASTTSSSISIPGSSGDTFPNTNSNITSGGNFSGVGGNLGNGPQSISEILVWNEYLGASDDNSNTIMESQKAGFGF